MKKRGRMVRESTIPTELSQTMSLDQFISKRLCIVCRHKFFEFELYKGICKDCINHVVNVVKCQMKPEVGWYPTEKSVERAKYILKEDLEKLGLKPKIAPLNIYNKKITMEEWENIQKSFEE